MKAENLVIGKVYKTTNEQTEYTTYFEFIGYDDEGDFIMKYVGGCEGYAEGDDEMFPFFNFHPFYELNYKERRRFNKDKRDFLRALLRMFSIKRNRN